jgi:hypothetical protein
MSASRHHWEVNSGIVHNSKNNNNNIGHDPVGDDVSSPNSSVASRPSINSATYTRPKPDLSHHVAGAILPVGYPIFCLPGEGAGAETSSGGFQNPWEALHHNRQRGTGDYFMREPEPNSGHFFQVWQMKIIW